MATTTPRIGLTKPDGTDLVDIAVLNTNFDKIDSNIASTKIQSTKPTTANAGDLWWDSDTGTLYLYYTDANSSQWVAATSDPINIGVVANQTERDAQYPTPAQGMSVYRTDLGVTQRYYGLFNSSTNPGGRDTAGWYNTEKTAGLVPISPSSVVIAGGTGSANGIGAVSFTGAGVVSLNGVFTSAYKNYRLILDLTSAGTIGGDMGLRLRASGTDSSATSYYTAGTWNNSQNGANTYYNVGSGVGYFGNVVTSSAAYVSANMEINGPQVPSITKIRSSMSSLSPAGYPAVYNVAVMNDQSTSFDGISIFGVSGTVLAGTVQIFGYNDK